MPLHQPRHRSLSALLLLTILCALPVHSQDVLTYHNNNSRTGFDNKETVLTLANVNSTTFGKLFVVPSDGLVDAQPLPTGHALQVEAPGRVYDHFIKFFTA